MATVATESMIDHATELHHAVLGVSRSRSARVGSPTRKNRVLTEQKREELPRAASYTYLPTSKHLHLEDASAADVNIPVDVTYTASQPGHVQNISPHDTSPLDSSECNTPDDHAPAIALPRARDIAAQLRKSLSKSHRGTSVKVARSDTESSGEVGFNEDTGFNPNQPIANTSFPNRFSRRSWISTASSTASRSPSPRKQSSLTNADVAEQDVKQSYENPTEGRRKSLISRRLTTKSVRGDMNKNNEKHQSSEEADAGKPISRKGTFLRRRSKGIVDAIASTVPPGKPGDSRSDKAAHAVPSIPQSFSSDRLPTLSSMDPLSDRAAPVPRLLSPEKAYSGSPLSLTKRKDELWGVFRSLDADFAKFLTKSSALKANVVRNSLIPFLRTYASHPSNKTLRLEDLDRRTIILNKWWTGLIELLHGRNNQSISGIDRPAILDGVLGIMERPEWRLYPSTFCSLPEQPPPTLSNGNRSHTSLGSSSSDFLADSVHHNVRNIFIQGLSSQMAFVVDKMSLRNASASLVNFCGKACAYAFMFVPGMADMLVRLWNIPGNVIQRVLREYGIGRFEKLPESANDLVANFPPSLHQLGFTSFTKYMHMLRVPPSLPLGTSHIPWWDHWLERWSGRESDLFYTFVKQYHILAADFMPSNTTKLDRLAMPGMLAVNAQILSNLDATIHRDVSQVQQDSAIIGPSATFDELLGDPDAVASALPVPPMNATRLMAENRLIMLVRDFLSDRTATHPTAKDMFAQAFNDLLQAAVRSTSVFDHSACYTLLDFLEEALVLLVRYEHLKKLNVPLVDPQFWQDVWRRMMDSENTMTEIRLYAFLYTTWNTTAWSPESKVKLSIELLLDPDVFESRFNHWCPMVRAYYMRLLCWRLARHDSEEDCPYLCVLERMQQRLLSTWSHYLSLRDKADSQNATRPATNPCYPVPGRRMLIIRTDNLINNAGSLLSLDASIGDMPSQMSKPAWKRTSSTSILDGTLSRPQSSSSSTMESEPDSTQKGIGGFLKKMIWPSKSRPKSQEPATDPSSRPVADLPSASATSDTDLVIPSQHRSLSFKFSFEMYQHSKQLPPMRLLPPRLPPPAQAYLQAHSKTPVLTEDVMRPTQPTGPSVAHARYSGRALAEWAMVVGECYSFFERRKNEGVPGNKYVETPTLAVEIFKRPS